MLLSLRLPRHRWPLAVLLACMAAGAAPPDKLRALELDYLRAAVKAPLLPYASIEIPALDNLRVGSDERGPHLGLRTYHRQPLKNGGVRAEISVDFPFREGDTVRYAWRMKLPADFSADAPANRWWLMAQWHDQPNRDRGETWEGYPGHSPSVALGYGQIDGQDKLSLLYGAPDPVPSGLIALRRGVWQTVAVEITWSRGESGRVRVFLDDAQTPVREARGRNMYNDFQQYMKLGQYRHPDIRGDATLLVADIDATLVRPR